MKDDYKYLIGIDEVGRGPVAGPVTVCAFVVKQSEKEHIHQALAGITDSKKLSVKKREYYYELIRSQQKQSTNIDVAISHVSAKTIDKKGIVHALDLALRRCLKKLGLAPEECYVYLDGGLSAPHEYNQETIIKGDQKVWQISAASVLAKVSRDKKMCNYAQEYPDYGFERHKGYGTKRHRAALAKYGPCDIHRRLWIRLDNKI